MRIPAETITEAKEKFGEKAAFLIAEKLDIQNWDERNLKGSCPLQNNTDNTPSFIWNSKEACFHCFSCGRNFGIIDFYMECEKLTFIESCEKLFADTAIDFRFGEKNVKTIRDYNYPVCETSDDRSIVDAYCLSRKISKETLDYCNIQQSITGCIVWNFYDENDVLLTVKCRQPHKITKKENKEWYLPDFDNTPILYNMNKIDISQKILVITEGQFDTLAIIESGFKNCVSVPGGSENMKWIETCFDWLDGFEKIVFFGDNDESGKKMVRDASARLGHWRCYNVDMPKEIEFEGKKFLVKDANELLYYTNKETVLRYIENAHDFPVPDVLDLYDADDFDIETAPGLITGLKSVNDILYKFLYGSVVVLTGLRGSGKSTFANQTFICDALEQNESAYVYSGELSSSILRNWFETTLIGRENIEMKDEFVRKFNPEAKQQMRDWYRGRIWVYDGQTNDADIVLDRAVAVTRKFGCKLWLIDNLTSLSLSTDDPKKTIWEKQKDFMVKLISLAKMYDVLVALIVHPRKMSGDDVGREIEGDDVAGAAELTNLAQYIVATHRYTKKEKEGEKNKRGDGYVKGKEPVNHDVKILVKKNRPTGRLGEANFYFDFNSYRFFETPRELWHRYKWDKSEKPMRTDDPNRHGVEAPLGFGED